MRTLYAIIIMVASTAAYAQVNLDSMLVAHWPMDGNTNDVSGNANHGTVVGAALTNNMFGVQDMAYNFDGIDDHIAIPTLWASSPSAVTVSAWFNKPDSVPEGKIVYLGDNGEFQLLTIGDSVYAGVHLPSGWVFTNGPIIPGNWHFAAARWVQDEYIEIYIDGNLVDSTAVGNEALLDVGGAFGASIGSYNQTQGVFYTGQVDNVRIYDRALSDQEMDSLYFWIFNSTQDLTKTEGVELHQNIPNPVNEITTIVVDLNTAQTATLQVFDVLGAEVASLYSGPLAAGQHRFELDCSSLNSGIYLYELRTRHTQQCRRLIVH